MNSVVAGLRVSGTIFAFVAFAHVWRLVRGSQFVVGRTEIPMWVSLIGVIVAGALSLWMWRLAAKAR